MVSCQVGLKGVHRFPGLCIGGVYFTSRTALGNFLPVVHLLSSAKQWLLRLGTIRLRYQHNEFAHSSM